MVKATSVKPAESNLPISASDFSADASAGFENADSESFAIPFLSILQSGSPQCKKSDGAYIPGAEEGFLYNSVTQEVLDPAEGIRVIPCSYTHSFVEWALREAGGGYRGEHPVNTPLRAQTRTDEKGRDILPNGNQLNDTRTHYVLVLNPEGIPSPAVITMTSTQIKKSKGWMTALQNRKLQGPNGLYTPPMMSQVWRVSTKAESNDKGSWYGWHFEPAGMLSGPDDPLYIMAREFSRSVAAGSVKADQSKTTETGSPVGEDIPF
jgi:hypothetical protein